MGSEREFSGYSNALADRGHIVHMVNLLKTSPDWSIPYDVCHLVNASGLKGCYILATQLCKEKGIPVLMSPVYWPTDEVEDEIKAHGLVDDNDSLSAKFEMHLSGVRRMLFEADWLLPNAEAEMEKVAELMGGETTRFFEEETQIGYTVIRNGIDVVDEIEPALALTDDQLRFDSQLEDLLSDRFILCVARVEIRKNQAALIQAMKPLWEEDPDLQLVLMGARSAPYIKYLKETVKGKNVLFCPPGPITAVTMMMRRCAVHALVSFIETPGLVSLEAAALNKPVVLADRGSVSEYFRNVEGAFYCDPQDVESITLALRGALEVGEANILGEFVRNTYSYGKIAEDLERVYKRVIGLTNGE